MPVGPYLIYLPCSWCSRGPWILGLSINSPSSHFQSSTLGSSPRLLTVTFNVYALGCFIRLEGHQVCR
jgi:hypothetical protein